MSEQNTAMITEKKLFKTCLLLFMSAMGKVRLCDKHAFIAVFVFNHKNSRRHKCTNKAVV